MRRSGKRDSAEKPIVDALRKSGCFVHVIRGGAFFDLVVGRGGRWYILEVKDPESERGRRLTADEIKWLLDCRDRAPIHVVRTQEEALAIVGVGNGN